jgi:hypothetical protein
MEVKTLTFDGEVKFECEDEEEKVSCFCHYFAMF